MPDAMTPAGSKENIRDYRESKPPTQGESNSAIDFKLVAAESPHPPEMI
jgi:hypothetical protein